MTDERTRTLAAALERLIPADELGPGAGEAGVVEYVQRRYAGPSGAAQEVYAAGLAELTARAAARHGRAFADLPAPAQDELLAELEAEGLARSEAERGAAFFETILRHAREGMFGDPRHGGNRDLVGWDLISYPDARRVWHRHEQALDVVVVPLVRRAASPPAAAEGRHE